MLLAAALFSGRSFPTRAFVLRQADSGDGERQGKGKGKGNGKGKGKNGPERTPATVPGIDPQPRVEIDPVAPVLGPGRVDGGDNVVENPNNPKNGGREGVAWHNPRHEAPICHLNTSVT